MHRKHNVDVSKNIRYIRQAGHVVFNFYYFFGNHDTFEISQNKILNSLIKIFTNNALTNSVTRYYKHRVKRRTLKQHYVCCMRNYTESYFSFLEPHRFHTQLVKTSRPGAACVAENTMKNDCAIIIIVWVNCENCRPCLKHQG